MGGTDLEGRNAPADHRNEPEPKRVEPEPHSSSDTVLLGHEVDTNNPVEIGERERRSGLYVLGKPRMGKSTLFVNMIAQDILQGRSVFFLDPHGQAITDLFERYPHTKFALEKNCIHLLDPTDNDYSFGLNPLFCPNVTSLSIRQRAYDKSFQIFKRIWEKENQWGVWLERILQSLLPIFIELQEYTLAEMPLFLNDSAFRAHILEKVKYNTDLIDYWQYEYEEKQAQSARNRIGSLLANPFVRHIIGQLKPTIDFEQLVKSTSQRGVPQFVFLRLPASLADDARHFIGTIVVTELFHAIETRKGNDAHDTFCLYVDEFQHFATSQFGRFIRETGKWGCAVALAHQDRRGQFRENEDILGATLTCANRVVFQVNESDARELNVAFAEKPVALQTRLVPEMVVCKDPMWDLLRRGHKNPRVQELFRKFGHPAFNELTRKKIQAEHTQLIRSGHFDEAMLFRDHAGLSGVAQENRLNASTRREISHTALDRSEALLQEAMRQHGLAKETLNELQLILMNLNHCRRNIQVLEAELVALMEGRAVCQPGDDTFARFTLYLVGSPWVDSMEPEPAYELYIWLTYGDRYQEWTIRHLKWNTDFLRKYFYPQVEAAYLNWELPILQKNRSLEKIPNQLEKKRRDFERGYVIGGYTSPGEYLENQWIPPGQYIEVTSELFLPLCDVPLGVNSGK